MIRLILAVMACPIANHLLKTYTRAICVSLDAQIPLLTGILEPGPKYRRALETAIQARSVADAARRDYWEHMETHGCRREARSGYSRAAKDRLKEEMLKVRRLFDSAFEKYDYLVRLSSDCPETPDNRLTLMHAQFVPVRAYEVYSELLRRYADCVLFGRLPEAPSCDASADLKPN